MKDCLTCKDVCCVHAEISLNIFDAAKLLAFFPCYKIKSLSGDNNLNLDIYWNNQIIFEIRDKAPRLRLPNKCNFLNEINLCNIHNNIIEQTSPLGILLQQLGVPLYVKPMICRQHPIYYELGEKCLREYDDCELHKNNPSHVITDHFTEKCESELVCRSYYALYDKLEHGDHIWDLIQQLIAGKNPFE
jgi:hypothetical protein